MQTYVWITKPEPEHIYRARTIKQIREEMSNLFYFNIVRIAFRFETVYCGVIDNNLVSLPGYLNIPFKTKCLRLPGGLFWAAGSSDNYATMNEVGTDNSSPDGWTETGRAWVGATCEDQIRESARITEND